MRSSHDRFTIAFLCGEPGSGKSYRSSLDVVDRLCNSEFGIKTNLPLNVEEVANRCSEETGKPAEHFIGRIKLIPSETLSDWQNGIGGPWDLEANGFDLLLDEVHLFIPAAGDPGRATRWEAWLGEGRHCGWARLVFITQDETKVHTVIRKHTGVRYELTSSERMRDPIFRVPLSAWYELAASVTRRYTATVVLSEYTRVNGRLVRNAREFIALQEKNFKLYNSFSAAGGGAVEGGVKARTYQFQTRPALLPTRQDGRLRAPVWVWFFTRYSFNFGWRGVVLGVAYWLTFGGAAWRAVERVNDRVLNKQTAEATPATTLPPASVEDFAHVVQRLNESDRLAAEAWIAQQAEIESGLRAEVDTLKAETQTLSGKLLVAKKLVAIHDGVTWWDSGEQVAVGERLEGEGPQIETIDESRRIVAFVGGRHVRLGGLLRYRETPAEYDPRLERDLQTGGGSGADAGASGESSATQSLGRVHADRAGSSIGLR